MNNINNVNKIFLFIKFLLLSSFMIQMSAFAHNLENAVSSSGTPSQRYYEEYQEAKYRHARKMQLNSLYPAPKEQNRIDKMLENRLNLTTEQKTYLKRQKALHKREIESVIKQMQLKHDEIASVYMLGLPKFQSDFRTAPMKAQLVILKQKALSLKDSHRKDFESILTVEQKAEFEKIKKEFSKK